MNDEISTLIVGLGKTGLSCAHFLQKQGVKFAITDSRDLPPGLQQCKKEFPDVPLFLGGIDNKNLEKFSTIVVSPGVSIHDSFISKACKENAEFIGDIELFVRAANAPIVAITGSNGKSTVTTLLAEMAKQAGKSVAVGGNLGTPALKLLADNVDFYILELSSFQLETTHSLNAIASTVLNISADHMDRYHSLDHYAKAKQTIFNGDGYMVCNDDDMIVRQMREHVSIERESKVIGFSLNTESDCLYKVARKKDQSYLSVSNELLINCDELRMPGNHNQANALAALALGDAMDLDRGSMLQVLRQFPGLPHRMQWVAEIGDVNWYNDSKATNVGAVVTALESMSGDKVLIAGGQAKDADLSSLKAAVSENHVHSVVLIGEDAYLLQRMLGKVTHIEMAETMQHAVELAQQRAQPGDLVLLSPACASFDMFDNFEHRGDVFINAVEDLMQKVET